MNKLFVIDANCSWVRSLVGAMPEGWSVQTYRVYSPQWLPNGIKDLLAAFRARVTDNMTTETLVVVPGWNKAPKLSAFILQAVLAPSLRRASSSAAFLFTFPFYSHVAHWVRTKFPNIRIAYHAHDPFEFYNYPAGYVRSHEDRLVPICDRVFTISDKLREDFLSRYPDANVQVMGNAVSDTFLSTAGSFNLPNDLLRIRTLGAPIVCCVGQINSSYDWQLLETAAEKYTKTQFIFIGNLFEEGESTERIRRFFQCNNVHWLGPKPHHDLKAYMDNVDILLSPLLVNSQNDRRDTLRLYDYLSTNKMVVSTPIDSIKRHGELIDVLPPRAYNLNILAQIPKPLSDEVKEKRRKHLQANTWSHRARELAAMLDEVRGYQRHS